MAFVLLITCLVLIAVCTVKSLALLKRLTGPGRPRP